VGEYLPWFHNCGEETCPFTEPPANLYRESLEFGQPLPNSHLSPRNHIRVDNRAFTRDVHVKVSVELLGYDWGMWGGLQYFRDIVAEHYYQEVTGSPMFSVDFDGTIGRQEVQVCDTLPNEEKDMRGGVQWSLQFGSPSNPSAVTGTGGSGEGASETTVPLPNVHPLDPRAPLLSDSDLDMDWFGEFDDFPSDIDTAPGQSDMDACDEDLLSELGIYSPDEDLSA
jgi:hypothetical protein